MSRAGTHEPRVGVRAGICTAATVTGTAGGEANKGEQAQIEGIQSQTSR